MLKEDTTKFLRHWISLTLEQLVPATRHVTSPPSLPAAVTVLSVIGVNASFECSATTKVLLFLRQEICVEKKMS